MKGKKKAYILAHCKSFNKKYVFPPVLHQHGRSPLALLLSSTISLGRNLLSVSIYNQETRGSLPAECIFAHWKTTDEQGDCREDGVGSRGGGGWHFFFDSLGKSVQSIFLFQLISARRANSCLVISHVQYSSPCSLCLEAMGNENYFLKCATPLK